MQQVVSFAGGGNCLPTVNVLKNLYILKKTLPYNEYSVVLNQGSVTEIVTQHFTYWFPFIREFRSKKNVAYIFGWFSLGKTAL
jgi:hypothetical protein